MMNDSPGGAAGVRNAESEQALCARRVMFNDPVMLRVQKSEAQR